MINRVSHRLHAASIALFALASSATVVAAQDDPARGTNDFPTVARVEYVLDCMHEHSGPAHEMMYKCSCAADAVAARVSYREWVALQTFVNGRTMAGERAAIVRENKETPARVRQHREVQQFAQKECFIQDQDQDRK